MASIRAILIRALSKGSEGPCGALLVRSAAAPLRPEGGRFRSCVLGGLGDLVSR